MTGLADFIRIANDLKTNKRTGWVVCGVDLPESIADHSFMMALMCLAVPEKGIDKNKAVKMAIAHDLAESVTGDLISKDNWEGGSIERKEKTELERKAMESILSGLSKETAADVMGLWEEFEECKTPEARFVKEIDTAELLIQAKLYSEKSNSKKPLHGFWDEKNLSKIKSESIKTLVKGIISSS